MWNYSRRRFLTSSLGILASSANVSFLLAKEKDSGKSDKQTLAGEVGVTTSSFSGHLVKTSTRGKITLLELPKVMRDELDMRVIDLNTSSLASLSPKYLERVRASADKAGCVLTNLKLNQRGLDMNSANKSVREKAIRIYKQSIDAASKLGVKWARPLPLPALPNRQLHIAAYRELADYGAKKSVRLLVENYGWMQSSSDSVARLIKDIGHNVAASPDTGNWNSNPIRYKGLAKTFPLAVTCDFKAKKLGPDGEHSAYDLKRCFAIGWSNGFRGPWCLEHAHPKRAQLFKELSLLRDSLRRWMKDTPQQKN
jgi:hypothetical protein